MSILGFEPGQQIGNDSPCIAYLNPLIRAVAAIPGVGLGGRVRQGRRGADALGALGFAFVEIGTVTAQPQPGNPTPRLFRLVEDRAFAQPHGVQQRRACRR